MGLLEMALFNKWLLILIPDHAIPSSSHRLHARHRRRCSAQVQNSTPLGIGAALLASSGRCSDTILLNGSNALLHRLELISTIS
jgi:hypothetical protein